MKIILCLRASAYRSSEFHNDNSCHVIVVVIRPPYVPSTAGHSLFIMPTKEIIQKVSATAAGATTTLKFCEVCSYGDSYRGMGELIQCKQCHIFLHLECYFVDIPVGAEYVDKQKQFTCIACQYVEA
jgi:hypothetical protein